MNNIATITSKRQFTIPVSAFRELKLRVGDTVLVTSRDGGLHIEPMARLVDKLAGSVPVPARFKGAKDTDELIGAAKREYFKKQRA